MSPSYHFSLKAMCQNSSRAGSPGVMIPDYHLFVDDQRHDVDFACRDEIATFEPHRKENEGIESNGTIAHFYCLGTQLMLESRTPDVYVESPPSNDLPRHHGFGRTSIPKSDDQCQRVVFLRPGDTVCFDTEKYLIKVLANETKSPTGDQSASANEVQVESSIQQQAAHGATPKTLEDDEDTDDEEDDDDLDATVATSIGDKEATPVTSRPIFSTAVKETPSRPISRDSHALYPTAQDLIGHEAVESTHDPDTSTPAARAGAQRNKRESTQPLDAAESQDVFPKTKGHKTLTTYGGASKRKPRVAVGNEISESLPAAAIQPSIDETQSSPRRKRSITDEDEDDDTLPASTAPLPKRPRGRPRKASKAAIPAVSKAKPRGRPSNASKAAQNAAEHLPSSGKLTRRRDALSPDLDSHSGSTPQSPGTPMIGKAPTKIVLSNSKFADDRKVKAWLSKHGATIGEAIPGKRANFICVVGSGELATTAKVLRSLALGKKVVTDNWIENSMKEDRLLDLDAYIHDDLAETADISRGKLFEGKTLFITDAQMKAYGSGVDSIKELATAIGARQVEHGLAKKANSMSANATIILGGDENDPDAWKLTQEEGRTVYQKALLTQSIIRGELLVDEDELKWQPGTKTGKKAKK